MNPLQRYAATAPVAELAIIAGPGTGKTAVLAARAVHLVEAFGVHPSRIVAFTFTRAAAAELRARVVELGGEDMALLRVTTFHAFALGIVRADPACVGAPECFTIATEDAVQNVLGSLFDGPLKRPEARRCSKTSLQRGLSHLYSTANMPEGADIRALIQTFLDRLREFGLVPSGMLPAMAVAALKRSAKALEALSEVSHVLIDEAHDASLAELTIARTASAQVTRAPGVLSMVLDPRQAIYGWRGGLGEDVAHGIEREGLDADALMAAVVEAGKLAASVASAIRRHGADIEPDERKAMRKAENTHRRALKVASWLDAAICPAEAPHVVLWLDVKTDKRGAERATLHGRLLDVGSVLRDELFARSRAVILASATLTTGAVPRAASNSSSSHASRSSSDSGNAGTCTSGSSGSRSGAPPAARRRAMSSTPEPPITHSSRVAAWRSV